jgi:hypothetical protein
MTAESLLRSSAFVRAEDRARITGHFSTDKFTIAPCDVGYGVFANRDIWRGEALLVFAGPIIDFAETKRRGPRECMAIQVGPDRYLDTQPPGVFVNHSCSPNAGIRDDVRLVALHNIRRGQEIRFDYSTTMEEQSFTMHCLCGAPECRSIIGDFSMLPLEVRARYLAQGIVMGFIQKRYRWRNLL